MFLCFRVALENTSFQNWLIGHATNYLSSQLKTKVDVGHVNFSLFNSVLLENVLIEDNRGDTLLFVGTLDAKLRSNLSALIRQDIDVKSVDLYNGKFFLHKDTSMVDGGNIGFLLNALGGVKDSLVVPNDTLPKKAKPLLLNVEDLGLHNIIFESNDKTKGENMKAWLGEGKLSGIKFDAKENHLGLDKLSLDEFYFYFFKGERQFPPVDKEYIDKDSSYQYFTASANKIKAKDGHFKFMDLVKESTRLKFDNTMDFNDLDVTEINAEIDSFWMREDLWFKGKMKSMEAQEKSGFVLMPSYANDVEVTCEGLHLYDMQLNTPTTTLGDTLEMKYRKYGYPSFLTFVDDVRLAGKFKPGSKISVEDIFTFAPELQNNKFFRNSRKEVLEVEGEVSGYINSLKTKGFLMKIGNRLTMKGDLRSRNITVKEEEFFDFELENLTTDIASLRALVPDFSPPEQFDKLGKLRFKGRFTGFLSAFTADGFLRTELGNVRSNITLEGKSSNAKYDGKLALIDFDLGTWTDNPDLGLVNFSSEVKNGSGLDLSEISADLSAEVTSLNFKGYKYEALNVNGKFFKRNFEGNLNIKDDNIDMNFDGLVDLNGEVPLFRFKAFINDLKLKNLNLSAKPINLRAELDFDFQGLKLPDLDGKASARKVELSLDTMNLELDSVYAEIKRFDGLKKKIEVRSEVLRGILEGEFEIDELPKLLVSYAQRNFPEFTNKININPKLLGFNQPRYFDYEFIIENSKNLTQFISPKLDTIFNSNVAGYFDSRIDSLELNAEIEKIIYDNYEFDLINVSGSFKEDRGTLDLGIYHTLLVKDSINISNILLKNKVHKDTFNFALELNDPVDVLDDLNLNGSLTLDEQDYFVVHFESSNLVLVNHKWEILKDNIIRFGKDKIETESFRMTNLDIPEQQVQLNSIGDKGLQLLLQGIDLDILNSYINDDKFVLSGPLNIKAEVEDIFKLKKLNAIVNMDSFFINDEYFGVLDLVATSPDLQSPVKADVHLKKDKQTLDVTGNYYPPFYEANPDYLDLDIDIKKFPLGFSEAFLGENVSNTYGDLDGQLKLRGKTSALELTGDARVYDASTTVNYLQMLVYVPDSKIKITPGLIDLTGLEIYDKEGNLGTITRGGITKNNLKDFGLDIDLESEKFIAMDTKEEDNDAFYGRGIGKIKAEFRGDFANTQMKVTTKTALGTKIFLPITSSRTGGSELSFITFNSDTVALDSSTTFAEDLKGLDLELNLEITPEAEIQLVIDQNAGDILKGKGSGDLQINVTKEGDFTMEGNYIVEQGHYLFTLLNVVNKPFIIKKGGTIKWDGDPLGAKINLEAAYENLSATPYNFILEYLNDADDKSNAQRTTPVDLTMKLQGELFKPDISFNIDFPNLRGRLKNFTDSKLRIIMEDENELNRQVLGLIAFGSFFPSDLAYSSSGLIDGGINTLSELLSNQLSIYLSELLSEVITDVDIDFNYRYYEYTEITEEEDILRTGSELEIRLKKGLFNNRLVINAGSNIDVDGGGTTTSSAFLAGDLLIEYLLTPDGRFKIRFYSEWDETISGTENQTGVGFTYRRDFDKFSELFKKNRKNTFKIEKEYDVFLNNLRKAAAESINN